MNDDRRSMLVGLLLAVWAPVVALVARLFGKAEQDARVNSGWAEFAQAIRDGTATRDSQCDDQGGFLVPEEYNEAIREGYKADGYVVGPDGWLVPGETRSYSDIECDLRADAFKLEWKMCDMGAELHGSCEVVVPDDDLPRV